MSDKASTVDLIRAAEAFEKEPADKLQVASPPKLQMMVQATCLRPSTAVSGWWARAASGTVWPFNVSKGVLMLHDDKGGEIAETRNRIVAMALANDDATREVSDLAWLDDDVLTVSPLVWRALRSHDFDIRAGVYFSKEEFPQPLIFPARGQGTTPFEPDRCFPVWGVGMGLTLVKADVYRKMARKGLPQDKYGNPQWYRTPGRDEDLITENGILQCGGTEDLYFCDLASRMGFSCVVDTGKHAFGFHYDLATQTGYPREQWRQYMGNRPIVWQTKDGPVEWR